MVSCPCAFGLAVPSVVSISLNQGVKNGILLKKNHIFNKIDSIKSIVFDKTGTLISNLESEIETKNYNYDLDLILTIIANLEVIILI